MVVLLLYCCVVVVFVVVVFVVVVVAAIFDVDVVVVVVVVALVVHCGLVSSFRVCLLHSDTGLGVHVVKHTRIYSSRTWCKARHLHAYCGWPRQW